MEPPSIPPPPPPPDSPPPPPSPSLPPPPSLPTSSAAAPPAALALSSPHSQAAPPTLPTLPTAQVTPTQANAERMQAVQHEIEQRRVAQVEASRTKKYRPKRKPWSRQRKFLVFAAMLIGIGLSLLNTINNPPETDTVASGQPTPRDVALPGSQVAPDVSTTWPVHDVQQIVTTTLPQRTLSRVGVAVQSRQFRFVMPEEPVVETATEMELGVEVTWTSWTADDPEYYVQVNSTCVPGSIDQVSLDEAIGEYLDEVLEIGSGTLLVNESVSNSTGLIGRRTVVGIDRQRLFIEIYGGSGCLVTVASYSSSQEVSAEHTSVITSFLWSQ